MYFCERVIFLELYMLTLPNEMIELLRRGLFQCVFVVNMCNMEC